MYRLHANTISSHTTNSVRKRLLTTLSTFHPHNFTFSFPSSPSTSLLNFPVTQSRLPSSFYHSSSALRSSSRKDDVDDRKRQSRDGDDDMVLTDADAEEAEEDSAEKVDEDDEALDVEGDEELFEDESELDSLISGEEIRTGGGSDSAAPAGEEINEAKEDEEDPRQNLKPSELVAHLDKYIVGQFAAKKSVAVALRNRWRRHSVAPHLRQDITPKNILMVGPTGCGKTEIARRLALITDSPFIKVEATKFTEVGFYGKDVDSIIKDLVRIAIQQIKQKKKQKIAKEVEGKIEQRIVVAVQEMRKKTAAQAPATPATAAASSTRAPPAASAPAGGKLTPPRFFLEQDLKHSIALAKSADPEQWEKDVAAYRDGSLDSMSVEMFLPRKGAAGAGGPKDPLSELFGGLSGGSGTTGFVLDADEPPASSSNRSGSGGDAGSGLSFRVLGGSFGGSPFGGLGGPGPEDLVWRTATVSEAKQALLDHYTTGRIRNADVAKKAIKMVESDGIVFLDEIDKICSSAGTRKFSASADASAEGVQRDLLPLVEGTTVNTPHGPVNTDHILFICSGAFHVVNVSDMLPELQGRLPVRVELKPLTEEDFYRILTQPKHNLIAQQVALMKTDNVDLTFTDEAIREIAKVAAEVNRTLENIGARRLNTVIQRVMDEHSFLTCDETNRKQITIDVSYVREKIKPLVKNVDLSKYVL